MKWLTMEYIKGHSKIDFDCENELLELYGKAAEETTLNYLGRSYDDLMDTYGEIPASIILASLQLVEVSYIHRSPITPTNMSLVPYTFDVLVKPYMIL